MVRRRRRETRRGEEETILRACKRTTVAKVVVFDTGRRKAAKRDKNKLLPTLSELLKCGTKCAMQRDEGTHARAIVG